MNENAVQEVIARLERIETTLASIVEKESTKSYYDTAEIARLLGKAEFTVREWCRHGRVQPSRPFFNCRWSRGVPSNPSFPCVELWRCPAT